jgi:hypothetical protein
MCLRACGAHTEVQVPHMLYPCAVTEDRACLELPVRARGGVEVRLCAVPSGRTFSPKLEYRKGSCLPLKG